MNNKKDFSVILSREFLETEPNISVSPFFPLPKIHDQKLPRVSTFWEVKVDPLNPSRLSCEKRNGSRLGHWTLKKL